MINNDMKILIVEDDPLSRMLLERLLDYTGYTVFTAQNGQDGYNKYSEIKPDLIIADLIMPVMSGCEMIRMIREKDKKTAILICTGETYGNTKGIPVIEKPINMEILKTKLEEMLSRKIALDEDLLCELCDSY